MRHPGHVCPQWMWRKSAAAAIRENKMINRRNAPPCYWLYFPVWFSIMQSFFFVWRLYCYDWATGLDTLSLTTTSGSVSILRLTVRLVLTLDWDVRSSYILLELVMTRIWTQILTIVKPALHYWAIPLYHEAHQNSQKAPAWKRKMFTAK